MQKLSLIFGLLFLCLTTTYGQIGAREEITVGHRITYDSEIESLYIPCMYSSYQVVLRSHDKPYWYTNTGYLEPVKACNSFQSFKCYKSNWSNYAIYKDKILALSFNATDDSIPNGYGCKNPYINQQNDFYLTYRDRITDQMYQQFGKDKEGEVTAEIQLENYKEVTKADKGIFFYDFIVEGDSIYLVLVQGRELFIYQADDASELLKSKWRLLGQTNAPFEEEYFVITKDDSNRFIMHTNTQGEFHLSVFKKNPQLIKHSDKNLEGRIFIDDIYSDRVDEVTLEDFKNIELAENYGQAILKARQK